MDASKRPWLLAVATALACGAVYVRTLHPSIPGGDAGELVAVAARLEVAHPPGYPLYTLLAHLATRVPFGSVAWRVNLFSAVAGAAAAGVLAATVRLASGSAVAGVVAAGLFAFSPVVWAYAVGAEVFPLNDLLAALLFLAAWRRSAVGVALVAGLGAAHHHTLAAYVVPVAAWLAWQEGRALLAPRRVLACATAFGGGLACCLYLPFAARAATTLSWGDPTSAHGFVDHLLRRDYGTFRLYADGDAASYLAYLAAWASHAWRSTLGVGSALAAVGAIAAFRPRGGRRGPAGEPARRGAERTGSGAPGSTGPRGGRRGLAAPPADATDDDAACRAWTRLLVACLGFYVLAFHALANAPLADPLGRAVLARFWQQADVVLCLLAGIGFAVVVRPLPAGAGRHLAVAAGATLVAAQLARGFVAHDHQRDDTVARFGRALLEPLPRDALLLTRGDLPTNVARYLQTCEGVRPDVIVLDQELLTKPWYVVRAAREHPALVFPAARYNPTAADGFSMRSFLDANASRRPVAVYAEWKRGDASTTGTYDLWPMGLASRVVATASAPDLQAWRSENAAALRALDDYGWQPLAAEPAGTWERVALEDVWQAHHRAGWWTLAQAVARDGDPELLAAARAEFERAARTHPDPPWYLERNLGIVYERLALHDPSLRGAQLAAWRRYLATAPGGDEARPAIAATVARLERNGVQ